MKTKFICNSSKMLFFLSVCVQFYWWTNCLNTKSFQQTSLLLCKAFFAFFLSPLFRSFWHSSVGKRMKHTCVLQAFFWLFWGESKRGFFWMKDKGERERRRRRGRKKVVVNEINSFSHLPELIWHYGWQVAELCRQDGEREEKRIFKDKLNRMIKKKRMKYGKEREREKEKRHTQKASLAPAPRRQLVE